MNLFDIKNKVFIVAGAGRGLGLQLSKYLSHQNALVIGIDKIFSSEKDSRFFFKKYKLDLGDKKKLKKNFTKIIEKNKKIDGLVFCAGITDPNDKYDSFSEAKLEKVFNVNVQSAYVLNYLVANFMIKKKIKGSIINFTSIGAHQAFPKNPYYCTSKGALKQLTKSFAYDYGSKGIRFNNLVPGYFKTPMNKKTLSLKSKVKERSKRNLLLRWGDPSEICGAVHFLLSNASSYVTASDLVIDGGWLNKGI